MASFQFTPTGIHEIPDTIAPAESASQAQLGFPRFAGAVVPQSAPQSASQTPLLFDGAPVRFEKYGAHSVKVKPLNPLKLMRARLREIERELKRHEKLKLEREQLTRALEAAAGKPALVREIHSKRISGTSA